MLYYGDGETLGGKSVVKAELEILTNDAIIKALFETNQKVDQRVDQKLKAILEKIDVVQSTIPLNIEQSPSVLTQNMSLNGFDVTGPGNIKTVGYISNGNIVLDKNKIQIDNDSVTIVSNHQYPLMITSITDGLDNSPSINLESSRGTISSPQDTLAGDRLGTYTIGGYHNNVYVTATWMMAFWDKTANFSDPSPAAILYLRVGNNAGGFSSASFTGETGVFNAPVLQTGNEYTTDPDTRPSNPDKGMIIFEKTTNTFQGWNGSGWVTLG